MKFQLSQTGRQIQKENDLIRGGGAAYKVRASLIVAGLGFAILPSNAAFVATEYYSFGDSLTDSGNVALAGGPAYPSGRFSDGPTWAEYLSNDHLGLGAHQPSAAGGNNHAWGGAWTDSGGVVPTVLQQVGGFIANGGSFQSTSLVSIWAGANDFFGTVANPGGPMNPGVSVNNIGTTIDLLVGAGAQHILVLNLPDFGFAPDFAGGPAAAGASAWVQGYNTLLSNELELKRTSHGISLYDPDIFALTEDIRMNPGDYGFTNSVDPVFPDMTLDPALTTYWDGVHPTTALHSVLAREAFNSIPEPSTGILAVFAFGIACTRRLRR